MQKKNEGEGLVVSVVMLWIAVIVLSGTQIVNMSFAATQETIRTKCNENFTVQPKLEEKLGGTLFRISDNPDPAYLQAELEVTNAQYNKLQTLIGCYFDR